MPSISPVISVAPVYSVTSILSTGGIPATGGGLGAIVNPPTPTPDPQYATFYKAAYARAAHGGPVPSYPVAVQLPATVTPSGTATRVSTTDRTGAEARPLGHIKFKVVTTEDPGAYLGEPLRTNDLIVWGGLRMLVIGTAFPTGATFETSADLMR